MRIVIIDDHPLFRQGVAGILAAEPDVTIVGEGVSAQDAIHLTKTHQPDILFLDLDIPGSGLSVIGQLLQLSPATRIIILTASVNDAPLMSAFKAGAKGYVVKGVAARELISITRTIAQGDGYVSPTLAAHLLTSQTAPASATPTNSVFDSLTSRERQILSLVSNGQSNRQIADALSLNEKTIKNHMTIIMQKLGVRNRVEAAMLASHNEP